MQLLADVLTGNFGMLRATLADFSDQDMLVRPAPAANHALWQLGHLAVTEPWMLTKAGYPDAVPAAPDGWGEKFNPKNTKVDDASFFPKKDEVLAYYDRVRTAFASWMSKVTEAELAKPMPDPLKGFAPTLGHLLLAAPVHAAMHLGQFQVIRRKLGKPVLF
jgi:hypothetical protein